MRNEEREDNRDQKRDQKRGRQLSQCLARQTLFFWGILLLFQFFPAKVVLASSLPSTMVDGTSSLTIQSMSSSCYAFGITADILPCNPAFVAKERKHQLKADIYLGNNVAYLKEATDLLNGNATSDTVQKLFSNHASSQLEASLEAGYLSETYGVQITPLHFNYYSQFQNPSLPQINLFASLDESARAQFGSYLGDDLYWGIQARYLHRKFIANEFFLTDVLAENRDTVLATHEQNILFLEPSLLYSPEGAWWHPEFSAMILNLGITDSNVEAVEPVPEYHLTGALHPDFGAGEFGFGIDLKWDRQIQDAQNFATLGSYYKYGILKVMGSLGLYAQGIGFTVSDDFWNIGLTYALRQYTDPFGESINEHKTYVLFGAQI